jgi:hypothetical protein
MKAGELAVSQKLWAKNIASRPNSLGEKGRLNIRRPTSHLSDYSVAYILTGEP